MLTVFIAIGSFSDDVVTTSVTDPRGDDSNMSQL